MQTRRAPRELIMTVRAQAIKRIESITEVSSNCWGKAVAVPVSAVICKVWVHDQQSWQQHLEGADSSLDRQTGRNCRNRAVDAYRVRRARHRTGRRARMGVLGAFSVRLLGGLSVGMAMADLGWVPEPGL